MIFLLNCEMQKFFNNTVCMHETIKNRMFGKVTKNAIKIITLAVA